MTGPHGGSRLCSGEAVVRVRIEGEGMRSGHWRQRTATWVGEATGPPPPPSQRANTARIRRTNATTTIASPTTTSFTHLAGSPPRPTLLPLAWWPLDRTPLHIHTCHTGHGYGTIRQLRIMAKVTADVDAQRMNGIAQPRIHVHAPGWLLLSVSRFPLVSPRR